MYMGNLNAPMIRSPTSKSVKAEIPFELEKQNNCKRQKIAGKAQRAAEGVVCPERVPYTYSLYASTSSAL